jgi:hypothetical protein
MSIPFDPAGEEKRRLARELTSSARLPGDSNPNALIEARHAWACRHNVPSYIDPVTGYHVFTANFLAERGYCCGSGCRHCPYRGTDKDARRHDR